MRTQARPLEPVPKVLLEPFAGWFKARGWTPRSHQLALLDEARQGRSVLLTAPTGGGKTLAGFLPSLVELAGQDAAFPVGRAARSGAFDSLHTLYISPLKALTVDIARNLETPVAQMGLPVRLEIRTGDTSAHKRRRQKLAPPDILLTTPEQLALLIASREAPRLFARLRFVVLDELHALQPGKRGDLLALGLARLQRYAPGHQRIGLSATVAEPDVLRRYLLAQDPKAGTAKHAAFVKGLPGAAPKVTVLESEAELPWSGHSARHALGEVMSAIALHQTTLVFVNTRSQAEFVFQTLWRLNDDNLPIALHHSSLSPEQRRKAEAAMARGALRAVVCTSTLDLGVDWGAVDLVVQLGAPKGASRLVQRIGRANHRLDEPSQALLVPANRFEVLECLAASEAVLAGKLDGGGARAGALDVLAQHILGTACAGPFAPEALFEEVRTAEPYRTLSRADFDDTLDFVATGGYALSAYDRYHHLVRTADGGFRLAHPRLAQTYRLNVGTIVEEPMLNVRLVRKRDRNHKQTGVPRVGGRVLGQIEAYFIEQLTAGDTFLFAGQVLRFEALHETEAWVTPSTAHDPMIPSYMGGKFPLSTYLAARVRAMIAAPQDVAGLEPSVRDWLDLQRAHSILPRADQFLVECFPRGSRYHLVCYPFEGRLAHQTLGMLLTRRLERLGMRPMGFVANEYALAVWALRDLGVLDMGKLFDQDMLGDDLEAWLAESALLKRTFRTCAIIAGLIPRRFIGEDKTGRQLTISSDLIYDVLRAHQPNHVLLRATFADAATGLLDIQRLGELLTRIRGRIVLKRLTRISPLAVPVMLEIGREPVYGEATDALLAEAGAALIAEAANRS